MGYVITRKRISFDFVIGKQAPAAMPSSVKQNTLEMNT